MSEELSNELVATEIMGWEYNLLGNAWIRKGEPFLPYEDFDPLHDLNHCAMAEKRMEELGKLWQYGWELYTIVNGHRPVTPDTMESHFKMLLASPEQRCRAMLRARGANLK